MISCGKSPRALPFYPTFLLSNCPVPPACSCKCSGGLALRAAGFSKAPVLFPFRQGFHAITQSAIDQQPACVSSLVAVLFLCVLMVTLREIFLPRYGLFAPFFLASLVVVPTPIHPCRGEIIYISTQTCPFPPFAEGPHRFLSRLSLSFLSLGPSVFHLFQSGPIPVFLLMA